MTFPTGLFKNKFLSMGSFAPIGALKKFLMPVKSLPILLLANIFFIDVHFEGVNLPVFELLPAAVNQLFILLYQPPILLFAIIFLNEVHFVPAAPSLALNQPLTESYQSFILLVLSISLNFVHPNFNGFAKKFLIAKPQDFIRAPIGPKNP